MHQIPETHPQMVFELPGSLFGDFQSGHDCGPKPILKVEKCQKELFLTPKGTWTAETFRKVLPNVFQVPDYSKTLHMDLSDTKGFGPIALGAMFEVLRGNTHKFQNIVICGVTAEEFRVMYSDGVQQLMGMNWSGDLAVDRVIFSRC
jgi:hypothetical protein